MRRMLRMWRGVWRKNDSQYWHFVPVQTDLGLSLYMDEGESFDTVEGIVRTHYGVIETTPMVITYGLPDWMVVPSGHTPPLTIGSTTELVDLMAGRPWMVEFTLIESVEYLPNGIGFVVWRYSNADWFMVHRENPVWNA
ncbi:hypothetical protein F2Q69_00013929 [Brassica cretica]|uniref:Uncharacterized protein n=1 Tax=Brassica cretica TaxID=69181 RepID=A0A8S9R173_BRACR|nr:hypothetical protein F2Q69_00013929 [Brassica cretica]